MTRLPIGSAALLAASTLVASTLVAAALAAPATALEEPPTCNGQAATIVGTDGSETVQGTAGPDVVVLGAGGDVFKDVGGDDVVCGGPGNDWIGGGPGDDWIDGGDGHDLVHDDYPSPRGAADSDGADTLLGGAGDDRILVHAGDGLGSGAADTIDGGAGTDRLDYAMSAEPVAIDAAAGTATGSAVDTFVAMERYVGTYHADVLLGTDGPDFLDGQDGADHLDGRGGDDVLMAFSGLVLGGDGDDEFRTWASYTSDLEVALGAGDDLIRIPGGSTSVYRGNEGADVFLVEDPDQGHDFDGIRAIAYGGKDHDVLTFARFHRGAVVDVRDGRARFRNVRLRFRHVNEFHGSPYADTMLGSAEADVLRGRGGADVLRGRRGRDLLRGGTGRDLLRGGTGRDLLRGGTGRDLLRGGTGRDTGYGGPGNDTCRSIERAFSC